MISRQSYMQQMTQGSGSSYAAPITNSVFATAKRSKLVANVDMNAAIDTLADNYAEHQLRFAAEDYRETATGCLSHKFLRRYDRRELARYIAEQVFIQF